METDTRTTREIGESEPGWARFERAYRLRGTKDPAFRAYATYLGAVRKMSPKPLLELSIAELEDLDLKLLGKSKTLRTVLKMFFRGNKRLDLVEALPRQRRDPERRRGLDETLMPGDIAAMIEHAGSTRDCAIIAVLASTGGRINEVLSLRRKDMIQQKGDGVQMWFGDPKSKGQGRYSEPVEGMWKTALDDWLAASPADLEAWLFPSTAGDRAHVADQTVADMLRSVAKKAGVTKRVSPHMLRHARISWGVLNKEDLATLCTRIWGVAFSAQINRYSHYRGLEGVTADAPAHLTMPAVPALPVPPVLSTQKKVGELTDEVRQLRESYATLERGFRTLLSKWATDKGVAPGTRVDVEVNDATGEVEITVPKPAGSKDEPQGKSRRRR